MLSTDSPKTARPSSSMTIRKPRRLSRRRRGGTGPRPGLASVTGARGSAAVIRAWGGGGATGRLGHPPPPPARHRVLGVGVAVDDRAGDEVGHEPHLVLPHPLRGHARRADPDAGRDVGLLWVERDGVLVHGDAGR